MTRLGVRGAARGRARASDVRVSDEARALVAVPAGHLFFHRSRSRSRSRPRARGSTKSPVRTPPPVRGDGSPVRRDGVDVGRVPEDRLTRAHRGTDRSPDSDHSIIGSSDRPDLIKSFARPRGRAVAGGVFLVTRAYSAPRNNPRGATRARVPSTITAGARPWLLRLSCAISALWRYCGNTAIKAPSA